MCKFNARNAYISATIAAALAAWVPAENARGDCAAVSPSGQIDVNPKTAHVGDPITITTLGVGLNSSFPTASCSATNCRLWIMFPNGNTNNVAGPPTGNGLNGVQQYLAETFLTGHLSTDVPAFSLLECIPPFSQGPAFGTCLPVTTIYVVNAADINKTIGPWIGPPGSSNETAAVGIPGGWPAGQALIPAVAGQPKKVQFIIAGDGIKLNPTAGNTLQGIGFTPQLVTIVTPGISVTKHCVTNCAPDSSPYGQPISFTGTICNTGDTTLTNVFVVDSPVATITYATTTTLGNPFPAGGGGVLLPNDCVQYSGSYNPTGNLCGPFTDTIVASGTDQVPPVKTVTATNSATCLVCTTPCIRVTKNCGPAAIDLEQGSFTVSGSVTNCGNVPLSGVTLIDTITNRNSTGGVISVQVLTSSLGPLAVGGSATIGPITITAATCGSISDFFTVIGTNVCGGTVSGTSGVCTTLVTNQACVSVTKSCGPAVLTNCNGIASYTVSGSVSNCGTAALTGVVVTDTITNIGGTVSTVIVTNIASLPAHTGVPLPPQTISTTNCGGQISDFFTATGSGPCGPASATSHTCVTTVVCGPPQICVTKGVTCAPAAGIAGCNSSLTYGPTATGVAGTNNPAFCYRIVVANCGCTTLTNVQVSDNLLPGVAGSFPTTLAPGQSVTNFYGQSYGLNNGQPSTNVNTVTASGVSAPGGVLVTTNASTTAVVVPARVSCDLTLTSPINLNTNGIGPCQVTLPFGSTNSPVAVTLTVHNTGQANLNVSIIGGNVLTGLVNCTNGSPVTNLANLVVFVPAGVSLTTNLGCALVSCPGATITATVQGTAVASTNLPCVHDITGSVIRTAPSSCSGCVDCFVPPPRICVTKAVTCAPATGIAGCNSSLTYRPTATGVAGTNNPAFCYRIVVANCGGQTLTNVQVSDNLLPGVAGSFPTTLVPGQSVTNYYGQSYGLNNGQPSTNVNTVTASGVSAPGGVLVTTNASATAVVVPARVSCDLTLTSAFNLNTNGTGQCPVTLPAGSSNSPVAVALTIHNTGQANLDVRIIGGNVLTSLVSCADDVTPVTNLAHLVVFVPAGASVTTNLGCALVTCPGATITATVQGTAVASTNIPCIHDSTGAVITTAPSSCSECVNCAVALSCRVTGGGTLYPDVTDTNCVVLTTTLFDDLQPTNVVLDHISHGGQLGAPFSMQDCGEILGNPCIRGQWQHNRHYQGTGNPQDQIDADFHSNTPKGVFDTLMCACLGCCEDGRFIGSAIADNLCNPDDHKICGPQPRPAPANAIIFTGIGTFKPQSDQGNGRKSEARYVIFRVYVEDRSEPGGLHPGGAKEPADVYCFQAWDTGIPIAKKPDFSTVATAFRRALAADSCAFIQSISTSTPVGLPPGSLPPSTVAGMAADIVDQGPLYDGNQQIHPSTSATCP